MTKGGDAATSNKSSLRAPASPYAVMVGINSDLPGQIIAEVTQPVYDTATGHYVRLPQGSYLVDDSQVAFGQQRVRLVWLRLVLPDTSCCGHISRSLCSEDRCHEYNAQAAAGGAARYADDQVDFFMSGATQE